jgi:hypothetical protein
MQWLTGLECEMIGSVVGRVIAAQEVRYDNCGPLYVPIVKKKCKLYDDIVLTTKYQKNRNQEYFTVHITASLSRIGLGCIITDGLLAFTNSITWLKLFIEERPAPIAFIFT